MIDWCVAIGNTPEPDRTNGFRAVLPPSVPTPAGTLKARQIGRRQNDGVTIRRLSRAIPLVHPEARYSIRAAKMPGTKLEDTRQRWPESRGPYQLQGP